MNNKSKYFIINILIPLLFTLICIYISWMIACYTSDKIRYNTIKVNEKSIVTNLNSEKIIFNETLINKKIKPKTKKKVITVKEENEKQDINLDFNILSKSGYTSEELKRSISTDTHKRMMPYVDIFIKAERQYGVNALYLMSKLGLESGWCRYKTGTNNIAGWTDGKGSYRNFDSVESCIMHVAYTLSTFYKQEVGTRLEDVCGLYCPDDGYVNAVMDIMNERKNIIENANS